MQIRVEWLQFFAATFPLHSSFYKFDTSVFQIWIKHEKERKDVKKIKFSSVIPSITQWEHINRVWIFNLSILQVDFFQYYGVFDLVHTVWYIFLYLFLLILMIMTYSWWKPKILFLMGSKYYIRSIKMFNFYYRNVYILKNIPMQYILYGPASFFPCMNCCIDGRSKIMDIPYKIKASIFNTVGNCNFGFYIWVLYDWFNPTSHIKLKLSLLQLSKYKAHCFLLTL